MIMAVIVLGKGNIVVMGVIAVRKAQAHHEFMRFRYFVDGLQIVAMAGEREALS